MPDDVVGAPVTSVKTPVPGGNSRRILGIDFFNGEAPAAIERMRSGGLLVVPAAPALINLPFDRAYRRALLQSDLAITDSAFMVLVWNLLERDDVRRLSGLEYFSHLVEDADFRQDGAVFYVMANEASSRKNVAWLESKGIPIGDDQIYIAPFYGNDVKDQVLVDRIAAQRPKHVVITVGGGVQERLGLYLKLSLNYLPAIHCVGAAIAFKSGDQVAIPPLADRLGLGWLLRCLWRPKSYVPRYWNARKLAWLLLNHRAELPPMDVVEVADADRSSTFVA
jgi:N-acetylglucosaminyldiphosphoundecaprenol N-acetyl-beta-D-mannosaminyltransferase